MKATEGAAEDNMSFENESAKIMNALAQEAEQVIAEASEAARQEMELEMERALREYAQRTRQLVLKIREEAKSKTLGIANRLGEAIMLRIEKSSTEAVAEVVAEFNKKAVNLTKALQETTEQEAGTALAGITVGTDNDGQNDINNATPRDKSEAEKETEKAAGEAKQGFEIEVERKITSFINNEANGGSEQTSEEFQQWLTQ